jgi:predicted phosphodiesterase
MKKLICLPDVQMPYGDMRSINALIKYMKTEKWDYMVILGDFLDYFTISKYNDNRPGMIEGKTILKEVQQGEVLLDRLLEACRAKNKKCKVVYLEGNHEARAYEFAYKFPHLKGIIEPENVLHFKKKRITYIKSWTTDKVFRLGKAVFTHGNYTNQHHAKKMVEAYEDNVFYGHVHDCNSFNKTSRGTGKTKVGQAMGCLCAYPKDADYTKGWPKNWSQAFGVFYFLPDGHFNYDLVRIFNHRFVAGGQVFSG